MATRPPLPPFDLDSAAQKVRAAENAWNTRDAGLVSQAYSADSRWRNRAQFFNGREAILHFLTDKWREEQDYRLIKELWSFAENRISVRFAYESRDAQGRWRRSYGNEQWEFNAQGLMTRREASINDVDITEAERLFRWPAGPRPTDHPGLTQLGL